MAGENFEDMFASLIRDENAAATAGTVGIRQPDMATPPAETPATPPAETPAPTAEATPPAETPAPTAAAGGAEPATEIVGVEDTGGEPPPPAETRTATDDALARLADMLSQRQPAPPAPPAQTVQPAPPPAPAFSQDEQAFLTQYIQDFPDVVKAEGLLRRAEYNALTGHIFREVAAYFAPKLALLDQLADNTAYSQIVQRVPNYDTQRDQVAAWVQTQPSYLQVGMNHVIQQGTAEEIADLFNRFTQATGAASPQPDPGIVPPGQVGSPATPPSAATAELSPAVKQAAARLAPVNGKRSAPTQAVPPTFDEAFAVFAKAG